MDFNAIYCATIGYFKNQTILHVRDALDFVEQTAEYLYKAYYKKRLLIYN